MLRDSGRPLLSWPSLSRRRPRIARTQFPARRRIVAREAPRPAHRRSARATALPPFEFHVAVPGFGMPLEATLVFIERYMRVRRGWELVENPPATTTGAPAVRATHLRGEIDCSGLFPLA